MWVSAPSRVNIAFYLQTPSFPKQLGKSKLNLMLNLMWNLHVFGENERTSGSHDEDYQYRDKTH